MLQVEPVGRVEAVPQAPAARRVPVTAMPGQAGVLRRCNQLGPTSSPIHRNQNMMGISKLGAIWDGMSNAGLLLTATKTVEMENPSIPMKVATIQTKIDGKVETIARDF